MSCPDCGGDTVAFEVPEELRAHAPGAHAALCTECLGVHPAESGSPTPSFDAVGEFFPGGRGGAALALALGMLDSLALNRGAIQACCTVAEAEGVDVFLALDRLADADVEPGFDVERRRTQLADLL